MNKLSIVFVFFSITLFAQTTSITFTGSSFMYVKDRYVYVKNGIDLKTANNNIFLRNEAQLLQAGTSTSQNKGLGSLSVFQEGTVNNYAYNYWCSPIGKPAVAAGTFTNEPFVATRLSRPTTNVLSVPVTFVNSPSYDGSTSDTSLSIASHWLWTYRSGINYSDWIFIGASNNVNPGEGFTMKGTSGTDNLAPKILAVGEVVANNPGSAQRYDFIGKPNDGDITITVANGKQTLTGNPYSSAIDLKSFLLGATNTTGIAYFWEQDKSVNSHNVGDYKGGYGEYSTAGPLGTYNPATYYAYDGAGTQLAASSPANTNIGGAAFKRAFCPVGQGFMIEGNALGTTVTMKNSYRVFVKEGVANNSQFERNSESTGNTTGFLPEIPSVSGFDYTTISTEEAPQIKFNALLDNIAVKQSLLIFDPTATDGVDHALDAKTADDSLPVSMYFAMENNQYNISVIDFNINKKIAIGFKNINQANYKFTVKDIVNFTGAENVYMHDKINDIYTDIKNNVFEVNLPSGTNNDQFEITFLNPTLANTNFNTTDIFVFQNNTNSVLTISNPKLLEVTNVKLYDFAGKLIINKENLKSKDSYEFSTATLSEGVYVVKLNTKENKNLAQKIIISNVK